MTRPRVENRSSAYLERQAALIRESTVVVGGRALRLHAGGEPSTSVVLLLTGPGRRAGRRRAPAADARARRHRVAALELADLADPWLDAPGAVSAALEALGAQEAVLVGHALGASVAIAAADADPRIRALVLAAGWLRPTERLVAVARLWESLAGRPDDRAALARVLGVRALTDLGPDRAAPIAADEATAALLAAAAGADTAVAAARLRVPALVVGCAADAVVGIEGAEALLGAIDDARYAVVDAGHCVLAERPAELLALVERFLADPRRDPAGSTLPRIVV
ncbi:alpha/beta hydrolase [Rathayibacter sp. VKM Ac-2760]|uniref:alpha/beta fold hydrolase n=1 Tax=Rathayibacter sp. VKM Ac-2760 TaxID=2609253 RepID=UPI001317CAD4|nr:alpha/beta hydrolase [Rathayibacter sp. VKM Ac-2760]QHC59583.1 alpha/beta fold hydrolase [Rathayibacter sp. VKM Ac-2760]